MSDLLLDIRAQPDVLRRALGQMVSEIGALSGWADKLRRGELDQIVLTGMGGSYAVLFPMQVRLTKSGIRTWAVETSELLYDYRELLTERTLLIAVSQSGRSVELVRLLEELSGAVPVIGVTNTPDSRLARASDAVVQLHAGEETAVSTKTYTCSVAALALLTALLTGQSVEAAARALHRGADYIAAMLSAWETQIAAVAAAINPPSFLIFLGRGESRSSALAGALVVKETAKLPTEGMVSGQFRHGSVEVLAPGVVVAIFAGSGIAREHHHRLAADLSQKGTPVIWVGAPGEPGMTVAVEPPALELAPLIEIVPVQLLATELAARRGLKPGEFHHTQKVTTVE